MAVDLDPVNLQHPGEVRGILTVTSKNSARALAGIGFISRCSRSFRTFSRASPAWRLLAM
jgi:hypothetical protein